MSAWWEVIDAPTDSHIVSVDDNYANAGDLVLSYTYYDSSAGLAKFDWYNVSSGRNPGMISVSSYAGKAISNFYDGNTAEYIDERTLKSDGTKYLLRNYATAGWKDAYVATAGQPDAEIGSIYDHVGIDMYYGSLLSELVGDHLATPTSWNMTWHGCGS